MTVQTSRTVNQNPHKVREAKLHTQKRNSLIDGLYGGSKRRGISGIVLPEPVHPRWNFDIVHQLLLGDGSLEEVVSQESQGCESEQEYKDHNDDVVAGKPEKPKVNS